MADQPETNPNPHKELFDKLLRGWTGRELNYRPGYSTGEGFRVFLYIDKDSIQQRLDEVLGPLNWRASYRVDLDAIICKLELNIEGAWHWKEGGGAKPKMDKEQDSVKGGFTDSFRQAAEAWGFGRYLGRLPFIFWPGQTGQNNKWKAWENEKGLRDEINRVISGAPAADRRKPPEKAGGAADKKPATNTPGGNPPALPQLKDKPAFGVPQTGAEMLKGQTRQELERKALELGAPLLHLIEREFSCTLDDLSEPAARWLFHGLKSGWLQFEKPPAPPQSPADHKPTRPTQAGPEQIGFDLWAAGKVKKEGEHYIVDVEPKPATVWKKDGITQCDLDKRRKTVSDPMCAHLYAAKYFAEANANGKDKAANTNPPARA